MNNKIVISDLHVWTVEDGVNLFYDTTFNLIQKNIEYGFVLNDKDNPNVDIYLLGDNINNINTHNAFNTYMIFLIYLFHIRYFIKKKKLKLNKVFYILWNHEYYIQTWISYWLPDFTFKNYVYDEIEWFNKKEFDNFHNLLKESSFDYSSKKEKNLEIKSLSLKKDSSKIELFTSIYSDEIFDLKDSIMHSFIQEGIKDIFNLKEEDIINLIDTKGIIENDKLILWNTLYSPFLWKYVENNKNDNTQFIYYINDTKFLALWINSFAFDKLLKIDFNKEKVDNEIYEDFCKIKDKIKTFYNKEKDMFETSNKTFWYEMCHFLFHYHYLLIMETLFDNKDKNVKEIDLLTHFPFNYFTKNGIKGFKLENRIMEKEEKERQEFFAKRELNTFFNVDVFYLEKLINFILENYKHIKRINLYNWHTHIKHKDLWKWKIELNILNPSVERFYE